MNVGRPNKAPYLFSTKQYGQPLEMTDISLSIVKIIFYYYSTASKFVSTFCETMLNSSGLLPHLKLVPGKTKMFINIQLIYIVEL